MNENKDATENTAGLQRLIKALIKAQGEIKNVSKDKVNPFFHSKYAPLDSVWEAIKGPLHKNGLCISQATDIINGQAALVTLLLHESGEFIRSVYPLNPVKNDPQGLGAAITYARRFSLAALVGLVSEDDDDGQAASQPNQQATNRPQVTHEAKPNGSGFQTISEKQAGRLFAIAMTAGWTKEGFQEELESSFGYSNSKSIKPGDYEKICNFFGSEQAVGE